MDDFIKKLKENKPDYIYTHAADLDGFVSGYLLYLILNYLFNDLHVKFVYIDYNELPDIPCEKSKVTWMSDLNINEDVQNNVKGKLFLIDHHKWIVTPDKNKIFYLHDLNKSATLICYELLKRIVETVDNKHLKKSYLKLIDLIKDIINLTNIGDIFVYKDKKELIKARILSRYFIDKIKPLCKNSSCKNLYKEFNINTISLIYELFTNDNFRNYSNNYEEELEQYTKLYRKEIENKQNEVVPGIFNIDYHMGDYSLIFTNLLEEYPNVKAIITAILNPKNGSVSISVRSRDGKTAYHIAKDYFGGGGHPNAAGAVLPERFNNKNPAEGAWFYINDVLKRYVD